MYLRDSLTELRSANEHINSVNETEASGTQTNAENYIKIGWKILSIPGRLPVRKTMMKKTIKRKK